MGSGGTRIKTGGFYGTGAAISVRTVGFRPKYIELINYTSKDKMVWTDDLADASGIKTVAAGTTTVVTTGGITPLSDGFSLGTDADMNVDSERVIFIAHQ